MMKRILALILVVCTVLPFAACTTPGTGNGGNHGGGGTDTGTETLWQDAVGEHNFNDQDLYVSVVDLYEYELFGTEDSEDTLDQMLFKRNRALQERFNVNLVSMPTRTTGERDHYAHYNEVRDALLQNDAEFDVVSMYAWQSGKLITAGYYLDWRSEIPYCKDSINAGAAWWPQGINNDSTVCGKQYVAVSDICITAIEMVMSIVFNKDLVDDYNLAGKLGYQTMYDAVDAKAWTLDNMYHLTKDFYENTNQTDPGADWDDLYGFLFGGADAFAFAFGSHYIKNDGINMPELWTPTGGIVAALERLREMRESKGCVYVYSGVSSEEYMKIFTERHAVFATMSLLYLKTDTFHKMEDAYGVLPYPLLNSNQREYLSGTTDNYSVLSVPFTNFNLTMTGAVLEAISAYNNLNVNEMYYASIVTHRQTRDPESVRMIDIIMKGRVYDLSTYHYDDLLVSAGDSGSLGLFFRHVVHHANEDILAYWQGCLEHLPDDLDDLIDQYVNMNMLG